MKRLSRGARLSLLFACATVAVAVIAAMAALLAVGADPPYDGLQDPSFESGVFYPDPDGYWIKSEETSDNVTIVGVETPETYPTYQSMGNVTVTPLRGSKMLRLGVPRDKNNHQLRGVNSASQTFVPRQDRLSVGVRIFSWEARRRRSPRSVARSLITASTDT